ncbi:MAG: PilZ domain-containing protein [Magnetospirillum sp.]|nr:PilZ domain-containing protein [Magnetospirillum sp.]
MPHTRERRHYTRYPGQPLILEVDGAVHPLIDISMGGIGFEGDGFRQGQTIVFSLSSVLDEADRTDGQAKVVNIAGPRIGVEFIGPNSPLLKYILTHIGIFTSPPIRMAADCAGN